VPPQPTGGEAATAPAVTHQVASTGDVSTQSRKRTSRSAARVEQATANGITAEPAPRRARARAAEPAEANGTAAEKAPRRPRARRSAPGSRNGTAAITPEAPPQPAVIAGRATGRAVESEGAISPDAPRQAAEGESELPRRTRSRRAKTGP